MAYPEGRRQSRKNGQDIRQRTAIKRHEVRRRETKELPDLCRQYLDHRAQMLSRHYGADAQEWLRFLWREILGPDPFKLTSSQIEIWALERITKRKSKVSTVDAYVFAIHLFFKWAIKAGLTSIDPALDVQLPRYRRPFRKMFAQIEQVKTLISECQNQQLKFILYAGIHAGLRKAEITAAKWSWFDFERMTINVTRDEFFDTKDGEDRTIPLTLEFAEFLKTYPHSNDYMIYNGRKKPGRRYRYDFRKLYTDYIKAKCEEHGFPRITIHDMRRTFASLTISNNNISVYQVGRWLGDDTRTVEKHYGWLQLHKGEINGAFK
ncbi:MAG TPA: tyrosine-type recombinase/integrase [Chthoniobacterales bacterium]|jgi:integrase|nr:tyrosine-type recombinase/integrase [Chthoniobacterales bacterium]